MSGIQQVAMKLASSVRPCGFLSLNNARFLTKSNFTTSNRRPMESEIFADVDQETSAEFQRDRYVNQVTLVGEVTQAPRPLGAEDRAVGYALRVMTKRRFPTRDGQKEIKTYHNVVCFQKSLLPFLASSVNVNDRVFVRGFLDRFVPQQTTGFSSDDEEFGGGLVQVKSVVIEKLSSS